MTRALIDRFLGGNPLLMIAAGLMLVAQLGCGGGDTPASPGELTADQIEILALVGGVSDMASDLNRLRESFTKESAPKSADLKKYSGNMFEIAGDISISGDTASFPVKISSYSSDASVEKQWKATKQDGKWKLSDTPLP